MSQDDSSLSKAEEERLQRAMNRKARGSVIVKTSAPMEPTTYVPNLGQNRQSVFTKAPSFDNKPRPLASPVERPKFVMSPSTREPPSSSSSMASPHSSRFEIENLHMKKRTVLGTITSGRRDLEEVRNEIAKLKAKEAELVTLLEKREQAVQQINADIEALEQKDHNEDAKRKEEEKQKRIKEEIDRRKKEEEEEGKRRIAEVETERKVLNPQPVYSPHVDQDAVTDDGLNAEELRLMRAMSRPGKVGGVATRVTSPPTSKPNLSKQVSEAEKARLAEENKKKEEEQRLNQEKDLQQRIAHLQHPGGVTKTFISPQIYDFDADVKFIADFTNWEEIPITTPMDNNFTYSVSWRVSHGHHFFMFKINGKNEINKNLPTGLAPNGLLMNKVECS